MEDLLMSALSWAVMKFPMAVVLLSMVGVLRMIFKPLMTFLHAVVDATPSQKDNEWLKNFTEGKIYAALVWFLDLVASIKLPKPAEKK